RIVPSRQSVLGVNAGRSVARPPAALLSRPVVARTPPPRAPVPFDRQVAAIQQNGGRPLARAELARLQPATPVAPVRVIGGCAAVTDRSTASGSAASAADAAAELLARRSDSRPQPPAVRAGQPPARARLRCVGEFQPAPAGASVSGAISPAGARGGTASGAGA